jgi:SulP family sulfate permease
LAAFLLLNKSFAGEPAMIVDAMSMCTLLAGIWQMLFGAFGIDRIIKATPHPALAGFINGIALLVIMGQLWLLFDVPADASLPPLSAFADPSHLVKAIFAILLAGFILVVGARTKRVSALLVGLGVGVTLYYFLRLALPEVPLGPAIGDVRANPPVIFPFASLMAPKARAAFLAVAPALLISSLILALVAALESLLAYRVAQDLSERASEPTRDVIGQGVGNLVSALLGGVAAAASSAQLTANYEAGGRSRLSVLAAAILLLLVSTLFSSAIGLLPIVVIWAVLIAVGILLFDDWSLRSLRDALVTRSRSTVRRSWKNLLVMLTVTVITASGAVVGGTLVGIALSCILFIADMSRSIVRRRYRGDEVFSKRVRSIDDMSMLQQSGRRRAVLELQGVMFFGNADELSREIGELFAEVDILTLDLRGVSDIDLSAASILRYEVAKSRKHGKTLLLSSVPPGAREMLTHPQSGGGAAVPSSMIFVDLDSALERMEETALSRQARSTATTLSLDQHALFSGLTAEELAVVTEFLTPQRYEAGTAICREGDDADRVWMLTRGSVSVRVASRDHARTLRIASLAVGTIVGEIAFIEGGKRTATIIADEIVECYVLELSAYDIIVRDHPQIGIKLLANLLRVVTYRLRTTSDELRAMSG